MGYTIVIGERVTDNLVAVTEDVNAPTFIGDEATHNTNVRKPMYSGWEEFLQDVGLFDLFLDKNTGLMRNHPGIFSLTEDHFRQISEAYLLLSTFDKAENTDNSVAVHTLNFVRISWLRFWVRWALDNCENPSIWNY